MNRAREDAGLIKQVDKTRAEQNNPIPIFVWRPISCLDRQGHFPKHLFPQPGEVYQSCGENIRGQQDRPAKKGTKSTLFGICVRGKPLIHP
jgi:hypothetical protein